MGNKKVNAMDQMSEMKLSKIKSNEIHNPATNTRKAIDIKTQGGYRQK